MCSWAKQNQNTYDQVQLVIDQTVKEWRYYLQGANYKGVIQYNHKNLEYFQTSKVHSSRQGSRSEIPSAYDIVIENRQAAKSLQIPLPARLNKRLAKNGLWHNSWQPSQCNHTLITSEQLGWSRIWNLWQSMSRQQWSTDQFLLAQILPKGRVMGKLSQESWLTSGETEF